METVARPTNNELLIKIRTMIDDDYRSAEIIQTVVEYPEDFWGHIQTIDKEKTPNEKCKDLIYPATEYNNKTWIQKHRAKIICDFLMFWSKGYEEHRTMINEIINNRGGLMPNAYAGIQAKINERVLAINDLRDDLNENNVGERAGNISNKMAELAGWVALSFRNAATYTENVCAASAGKASDAASAIDHMLGDITKINFHIDLFEASTVGKSFIDSIVGHHTDTVILMLEGLVTVCAGTLAVQNYKVVFNTLLTILGYLESGLRVGAAGSVLYAIGSVTNLLSKKLGKMAEDKAINIGDISTDLAQISSEIRSTTGENVTPTKVTNLRERLEGVIHAAYNALTTIETRGRDRQRGEGVQGIDVSRGSRSRSRDDEERLAAQRSAPRSAPAEEGTAPAEAEAGDGPHTGGKKHKKSQKKPRKKASKSKRSKKAGKKTRKSRKKTRGKKH